MLACGAHATVPAVDKSTAFPMAGAVPATTPPPPPPSSPPGSWLTSTFKPPVHGEESLVSVDKLILFVAITCGAGVTQTLTEIDNIGQISGDGGGR